MVILHLRKILQQISLCSINTLAFRSGMFTGTLYNYAKCKPIKLSENSIEENLDDILEKAKLQRQLKKKKSQAIANS